MTRDEHIRFFQAAAKGDVETVLRFLESGVDVDFVDPNVGHTSLYNASIMGRTAVVEFLLSRGADPNKRLNYHSPVDERWERNVVVLMYARTADIAAALIRAGADVNAADENGTTPLMRTALAGKLDVVKTLLAAGASPLARQHKKARATARQLALSKVEFWKEHTEDPNREKASQLIAKYEAVCRLLEEAEKTNAITT